MSIVEVDEEDDANRSRNSFICGRMMRGEEEDADPSDEQARMIFMERPPPSAPPSSAVAVRDGSAAWVPCTGIKGPTVMM